MKGRVLDSILFWGRVLALHQIFHDLSKTRPRPQGRGRGRGGRDLATALYMTVSGCPFHPWHPPPFQEVVEHLLILEPEEIVHISLL